MYHFNNYVNTNSFCHFPYCLVYRYVYSTESGVMSLDIHPNHGNLFAVGFYDGENSFVVDSVLLDESNTLLISN